MPVRAVGRSLLQIGLFSLGVVSIVFHDFLMNWEPVPTWVPARAVLAVLSGVILVAAAAGLSIPRVSSTASRVLFIYLLFWVLLLKVPKVVMGPLVEGYWLGLGEISVVAIACWYVFTDGKRDPRLARILVGLALIPVGLSHFFYFQQSLGFVPKWLPARPFFVVLSAAGHVAAGLGILFNVVPYLAALMEAAMIMAFTLLVWLPGIVGAPTERLQWTAFWVSWTIGAAAWVIADSYGGNAVRAPFPP